MSNLFSTLGAAGGALRAFERALEATQNNVNNASTPGYAKQRSQLEALPFQLANGLAGGVTSRSLISSRDQYAEAAVRRQVGLLGNLDEQASRLGAVAAVFDVSGKSGIDAAFNRFYQSVSAWSVAPNSVSARQDVLTAAGAVANSFQQTARRLADLSAQSDAQIQTTVGKINEISAKVAAINAQLARGGTADPGLDASLNQSLEDLSELADITSLRASDGSITVLLGGQVPLVVGRKQFDLQAAFYPSPPSAHVLTADGADVAPLVTQGRLGGLLSVRNSVLGGLLGDSQQQGDLNVLAQKFADRVNQILGQGQVSPGPPPQAGAPLFTYNVSNPSSVASTLAVDPNITTGLLAAADPGPPFVSNGTALRLAGLANSANPADQINGQTYTGFYSSLSARVGRSLADARQGMETQSLVVAQARGLRSELSGVSLDEEATRLIELQRGYQANARMLAVVSDLTETVINLIR
jgi:flagellar hook-associated protein 1 FlgK